MTITKCVIQLSLDIHIQLNPQFLLQLPQLSFHLIFTSNLNNITYEQLYNHRFRKNDFYISITIYLPQSSAVKSILSLLSRYIYQYIMLITIYVEGKTIRDTVSILDTELRAFSESFMALVTHLK